MPEVRTNKKKPKNTFNSPQTKEEGKYLKVITQSMKYGF